MSNKNIEVVLNIFDIKRAEKLMGEAIGELTEKKINELPIKYRREVCEEMLQIKNNKKNIPK